MDSQDVRFYFSVFLRRLHYFLLPVVAVTLAGSLVAFYLPPVYVAVAKILVESPSVSANPDRPAVPADPIQQLQVLEQQLTTTASLVAMAEKFSIYPAADLSADEIADDMRARTKVEPVEFSNLGGSNGAVAFAISFEASDPVLSADVANAYANAILETNERQRKARAGNALEFFRREVARLGAALNEAQDAVLRFKREHEDALPDSLEFRRMQQTTYDERLRQLQREEVSLQQRRSALEQILTAPQLSAAPTTGRAPTPDELTLADLQRLLGEQQGIFSEDSPNLQMLHSRIEAIEKRLAQQRAAPVDISQRKDVSPELRMQFADMNGQLEFIAQEKEAVKRTLADLARSTADTEMNSTVLGALQRTYETTQAQYTEATSRLAEASTKQRIETEQVGQKFSLIESAAPPRKPFKSRRRLIALGSLAAGIGLGFGLVVLVEFWSPSIRRPADLAFAFDGQPFATIPYILTSGEMVRRRIRAASLVLVLLAMIPGFLLISKYLTPPIGTAANSIPTENRAGKEM
ncbi:hypothetical protein SAZ10_07275 [Mesorhizobium sp. BAC0120]|uniref:GumC family protein n=1 Tax=Mesorhizobium sp. BAC0120 TaxID=3090670 RepID=UPI00298C57BC|nr:hypothetical protein [Mesorhizobium sp. BAC0120]MDW6021565.1 hypothetical protein [Mesorhizobium sp. BAC0120]